MLHVVVGILQDAQQRILIAERPRHKPYGGYWEFPGGKVEPEETSFAALQREFQEELGIDVIKAHPWFQHQHTYPDRVVLLDCWMITEFLGQPVGQENQKILWVQVDELHQFTFPEGNGEILIRLVSILNGSPP